MFKTSFFGSRYWGRYFRSSDEISGYLVEVIVSPKIAVLMGTNIGRVEVLENVTKAMILNSLIVTDLATGDCQESLRVSVGKVKIETIKVEVKMVAVTFNAGTSITFRCKFYDPDGILINPAAATIRFRDGQNQITTHPMVRSGNTWSYVLETESLGLGLWQYSIKSTNPNVISNGMFTLSGEWS